MTLYLKYRPKNLDELDLKSVSDSLKKIVASDNIPHAFLFSGPKGTGKTSAARILAKIINCEGSATGDKRKETRTEPCDKCEQCKSITNGSNLDVIEMDAASHRGIDDIRMLRDAVKLAPVKAKKKIYIIDEAHMLTTEASNALLKTLEEPPSHVVFILATTNPEKLIGTIRSRVTNIIFNKASLPEAVKSLRRVADGEKIKIDDAALELLAKAANGAFRDGIKLLEQASMEASELTPDFLEKYLFAGKSSSIANFIRLLQKKEIVRLLEEVDKIVKEGIVVEEFTSQVVGSLRESLLAKYGIGEDGFPDFSREELVRAISLLVESYSGHDSPIEELPLELALIKYCDGPEPIRHESPDPTEETVSDAEDPVKKEVKVDGKTASLIGDDVWQKVLALVKPINASIEALLRASKPMGLNGNTLTLGVYYRFHKERLEDIAHRKILEDVLGKVLDSPTKVYCVLTDPPVVKIKVEAKVEPVLTEGQDRDIIKAAEEIFGN